MLRADRAKAITAIQVPRGIRGSVELAPAYIEESKIVYLIVAFAVIMSPFVPLLRTL